MEKGINYDTKLVQSEAFQEEKSAVIIPRCCVENWDSCPHRVKRAKKTKQNVGL